MIRFLNYFSNYLNNLNSLSNYLINLSNQFNNLSMHKWRLPLYCYTIGKTMASLAITALSNTSKFMKKNALSDWKGDKGLELVQRLREMALRRRSPRCEGESLKVANKGYVQHAAQPYPLNSGPSCY